MLVDDQRPLCLFSRPLSAETVRGEISALLVPYIIILLLLLLLIIINTTPMPADLPIRCDPKRQTRTPSFPFRSYPTLSPLPGPGQNKAAALPARLTSASCPSALYCTLHYYVHIHR
ncbi:unnamed protein product [Periconia digitata]|uniref:Uncharacterized protein n=1 Tax=Periconia digitata TaxID=1303443 RepID=A0A9W4XTS7_9PLEO|nr:unnamed protein product [Periconia digitata]